GPAGGDLTGAYPNPTVNVNKIDNTKLAQVTAPIVRGRATAGLGNVEDLTPAQATALLNVFGQAGAAAGNNLKGLVPAPGALAHAAQFFALRDSGLWAPVPGVVLAQLYVDASEQTNSTTAVDLTTADLITFTLSAAANVLLCYFCLNYSDGVNITVNNQFYLGGAPT